MKPTAGSGTERKLLRRKARGGLPLLDRREKARAKGLRRATLFHKKSRADAAARLSLADPAVGAAGGAVSEAATAAREGGRATPARTPGFCRRRSTAGAVGVGSRRECRRGDGDDPADRAVDRNAPRPRNPPYHRHGRFGPAYRRADAAADSPSICAGRFAGLDRA